MASMLIYKYIWIIFSAAEEARNVSLVRIRPILCVLQNAKNIGKK